MSKTKRFSILVNGVVQGVGFRPFVYNLAKSLSLRGFVLNTSKGVQIEVEGPEEQLYRFIEKISTDKPPRAEIVEKIIEKMPPIGYESFEIRKSLEDEEPFVLISPDIATCSECQKELFSPENRRYRYPFINCTNCGPRFTIIEDIPYDRPKTTMKLFEMCPECYAEYEDPANRRFHAQPNACSVCGPQLMLIAKEPNIKDISLTPVASLPEDILKSYSIDSKHNLFCLTKEESLKAAEAMIKDGGIVALKGLGGFHIACDATNEQAVKKLRERKKRPSKPFALMFLGIEHIKKFLDISNEEIEQLKSSTAPIVLIKKRPQDNIAPSVAPGLDEHGVMLPSTPLHHLLLSDLSMPLVMTSGNLSEEPIVKDNPEALERLSNIADVYLIHNRDIYSRYDDSVLKFINGQRVFLRRARSYAPYPLKFPYPASPDVLACGTELKCTFCLTKKGYAFVSQHLGDLSDELSYHNYVETIELYKRLFKIKPEIFACDLHPDYLATRYALENHGKNPLISIQHHHAHIASVLGEHGTEGPVIGFSFDGTGYGLDGHIWGGEVIISTVTDFERYAYLLEVPLPAGESAIKKPYRMAISYLSETFGDSLPEIPSLAKVPPEEFSLILKISRKPAFSPPTSSMGRLFDAVAVIAGVDKVATYEGELAMRFESSADDSYKGEYKFELIESNPLLIDFRPVIKSLVDDIKNCVSIHEISMKFHRALASVVLQVAKRARADTGIKIVALSGGVWQNSLLAHLSIERLRKNGFEVLLHRELPPNDGCISFGQAVVASAKFSAVA